MLRAQSPKRLDLDDVLFPCDRYGYVYLITFKRPTDGQLFYYVGQRLGKKLNRSYTGSGFILKRFKDKYGVEGNLHLKILQWAFAKDELDFKETLFIVMAKDCYGKFCMNIMYAGGSHVFTKRTRELIGSYHKGKTLSAEHRQAISRAQSKPKSAEMKRKLSLVKKGKPRASPMTPQHRANFTMAGKTHSDETKAKMSAASKGVPKKKSTCPHCGKTGGAGKMTYWHFDNCRFQ